MIEWSETDLLVRDSIREFTDKEVRPPVGALQSGAMSLMIYAGSNDIQVTHIAKGLLGR